ncbi:hypothetical protein [Chromatium okenii]|uniref:hypothetical protein n=1 Tax=Chromatium okenii TaxID=61644 RepID=UPI0026F33216|nr:hypothetical protein [Chromatium okenii]MBV5310756.1 hypothetical protein [Chromatium okenii]
MNKTEKKAWDKELTAKRDAALKQSQQAGQRKAMAAYQATLRADQAKLKAALAIKNAFEEEDLAEVLRTAQLNDVAEVVAHADLYHSWARAVFPHLRATTKPLHLRSEA